MAKSTEQMTETELHTVLLETKVKMEECKHTLANYEVEKAQIELQLYKLQDKKGKS